MTISAGMQIGSLQGSDLGGVSVFRSGLGLGFFSAQSGGNGYTNFLGIVVNVNGDRTVGSVSFSQAAGGNRKQLGPVDCLADRNAGRV